MDVDNKNISSCTASRQCMRNKNGAPNESRPKLSAESMLQAKQCHDGMMTCATQLEAVVIASGGFCAWRRLSPSRSH